MWATPWRATLRALPPAALARQWAALSTVRAGAGGQSSRSSPPLPSRTSSATAGCTGKSLLPCRPGTPGDLVRPPLSPGTHGTPPRPNRRGGLRPASAASRPRRSLPAPIGVIGKGGLSPEGTRPLPACHGAAVGSSVVLRGSPSTQRCLGKLSMTPKCYRASRHRYPEANELADHEKAMEPIVPTRAGTIIAANRADPCCGSTAKYVRADFPPHSWRRPGRL